MIKKPTILLKKFILVTTIIISFTACNNNEKHNKNSNETIDTLRIGINSTIKSAPFIIAEKLDYFTDNNIKAELIVKPSAVPLFDALFNNELDIASGPEHLVAYKSLVRSDFKIFAVINRNQSQKLIARKDHGIFSFKNLKNKKIGLKKESASPYWLNLILIYNHLSLGDITMIDGKPDDLVTKLANEEIDALISWNPNIYKASKILGTNAFIIDAQLGQDLYWTLIANSVFINKNHAIIKRLLKALMQAIDYINENPKESQIIIADYLKQDVEYIQSDWKQHSFEIELPQTLLYSLESECRWKIKMNGKKEKIPQFLNYIYFSALAELNSDAITIIN